MTSKLTFAHLTIAVERFELKPDPCVHAGSARLLFFLTHLSQSLEALSCPNHHSHFQVQLDKSPRCSISVGFSTHEQLVSLTAHSQCVLCLQLSSGHDTHC